jgi:hypothetical protein
MLWARFLISPVTGSAITMSDSLRSIWVLFRVKKIPFFIASGSHVDSLQFDSDGM